VQYIYKSLSSYYGDKIFLSDWRFDECDFSFLDLYKSEILGLPNITPNGIIQVKKENCVEYNKIQENITNILIETGLIKCVTHAQHIIPRIVDGKQDIIKRARPLSIEKYHSDSWASQKGDAVLSIIIGGDLSTTIEFCKPTGMSSNFFSSLTDYDDAKKNKFFDKLEYLGMAEFGKINIFDHACVHRTLKQNGGIRVSLEICLAIDDENSLFSRDSNLVYEKYRNEYIGVNDLKELGKSIFITADETMKESERYKEEQKSRRYGNISFKNRL
jgi:hypothetical protein